MTTAPSDKPKKWIVSIEGQNWKFGSPEEAKAHAKALLDLGVWYLNASTSF